MSLLTPVRPITVDEYYRLAETGVLRPGDRVELLRGEVREMSPIGPRHSRVVNRFNSILVKRLPIGLFVQIQNPIRLSDESEPQPDVCIIRGAEDDFDSHHPLSPDVLLVIEVCDTSLEYDRDEKLPAYAEAGIVEVWLVDVLRKSVATYRQPQGRAYLEQHVFQGTDRLQPARVEELSLTVEDLLGAVPRP